MSTDTSPEAVERLALALEDDPWQVHCRAAATLRALSAALEAERASHKSTLARESAAYFRHDARMDAAEAEVARLRQAITEASDPDFLWAAMDNVTDMDTTLTDYAKAASRAIRAAVLGEGGKT